MEIVDTFFTNLSVILIEVIKLSCTQPSWSEFLPSLSCDFNSLEVRLTHGGRIKNICIFDQNSEFSISLFAKTSQTYFRLEIMSSVLSVWTCPWSAFTSQRFNYKHLEFQCKISEFINLATFYRSHKSQIFVQDKIISLTWKCDLKITMINRSWQKIKLKSSHQTFNLYTSVSTAFSAYFKFILVIETK